jgi:hypothetical protein
MRREAVFLILTLLSLSSPRSLQAQYISGGQATGILVGVAVVGAGIAVGVTYLIRHNRGVATGCVSETAGMRVLTEPKQSYSLIENGVALTPRERYKLKGRISGSSPARTFTADKMLKDLGAC